MGPKRKSSKSVLGKRQAVTRAVASTVRELRATGFVSRKTIAAELNRRGVPTERSGRWHLTTVHRMMKRLGMSETVNASGPGVIRWLALNRAYALAPIIREIQSAGSVSQRDIARELNARRVPTPYGGKWHNTSINRLLHRLESMALNSRRRTGRTESAVKPLSAHSGAQREDKLARQVMRPVSRPPRHQR